MHNISFSKLPVIPMLASKKFSDVTSVLCCLFLGFMALGCFCAWMEIKVFGHDCFYYIKDYGWAIPEEGRWLNYLFFPLVRHIPLHTAICLSYLCLGFYCWVCVRSIANRWVSIGVVLAGLLTCPFHTLLQFPDTPLASYIFLAAFAYWKNAAGEKCGYRLLFFIGGIVFCGLYNHFYNFLPLLFLGEIRNKKIALIPFLCWYVGGFLFGFMTAEFITWLYCGHFIKPAQWRNMRIAISWADLAANFKTEYGALRSDLGMIGKIPLFLIGLFTILSLIYTAAKNHNAFARLTACLAIILCVMLSSYVQAFPVGFTFFHRTAGPLYIAIVLLLPLVMPRGILASLAIALLGSAMFITDITSLKYLQTVGGIYYHNLKQFNVDPAIYKIAFLATEEQTMGAENNIVEINRLGPHKACRKFGELMNFRAAANAAGFETIVFHPKNNPQLATLINENRDKKWSSTGFFIYKTVDDWLLVDFDWPRRQYE